ncbi:hypothetical protein [Schlesneria paludicola]|uniref:hypothetical protein n=1 Tax=Schlesneria paludicola TaxID=360056 RepID=UPI00029B1B5A|nr:hypothetical protein [Schlesneria paludicola]
MSKSIYTSMMKTADSILSKNPGKLGSLRLARDEFGRAYHPATMNFARGPSPAVKQAAARLLNEILAVPECQA